MNCCNKVLILVAALSLFGWAPARSIERKELDDCKQFDANTVPKHLSYEAKLESKNIKDAGCKKCCSDNDYDASENFERCVCIKRPVVYKQKVDCHKCPKATMCTHCWGWDV